jgi:hypothetical protein
MYWDKNANGIYDNGEQTSTPTSKWGGCTFSPALPENVVVRMKSKGIHNGVPFDGSLTANISGTGIVSPMTTLLEKFDGNETAVLTLLKDAGIELTAEDLTKDPMANLDKTSATLDNDIKRIQASVAINTFLSVIGNDSNATDIETAKDTLKKSVDFSTKAITTAHISSSAGIDSAINSAVAVANYITSKAKNGDNSALETLSTNATNVDTLMDALKTNYDNNPEQNFGLDATKSIADASNANNIGEVKSMTALQYFEFVGNSLDVEYSGGFDGAVLSDGRDDNGSDDLDPAYMGYESFTKDGTELKLTWKGFGWDSSDHDNDGNTTEHVIESGNFTGIISGTLANGTVTGVDKGIEKDGSTYISNISGSFTTNGNTMIDKFTSTRSDGTTEIDAGKEIFISAKKVTTIAGVPVGSDTRDVYKVKYKSQYGQMDGDDFVASGDGYDTPWGDYSAYDNNISKLVDEWINNKATASGGANSKLIFAPNGKFINKDTNLTVDDTYWQIIDNTLQVRAYDDYDFKIENGKCMQNWIGDMNIDFVGITPEEANEILKVLVPNENLTVD